MDGTTGGVLLKVAFVRPFGQRMREFAAPVMP